MLGPSVVSSRGRLRQVQINTVRVGAGRTRICIFFKKKKKKKKKEEEEEEGNHEFGETM